MSTPSVWRAGGVTSSYLDLETLMVAVLLHEGSHVAQASTYGKQIEKLAEEYSLPESFSDDSLQHRFENEVPFADSIQRETDLFFAAAFATDLEAVVAQASEARRLMLARAERWYRGDEKYWHQAEDLWLTFEGAGQWIAYEWLVSDRGAAVSEEVAVSGFARRSRWWSQNEGLAIALVVERLIGPTWQRHAFRNGGKTILAMLDGALLEYSAATGISPRE